METTFENVGSWQTLTKSNCTFVMQTNYFTQDPSFLHCMDKDANKVFHNGDDDPEHKN